MRGFERWQRVPVEPFSGWYEISDRGRVRRLTRHVRGADGKLRLVKGRLLKPWRSRGQLVVRLSAEGSVRAFGISRLVASAWIGRAPAGRPCAFHLNGNRTDNRVENLEWRSASAVQKSGAAHPKTGNGSKLTPEDVLEIRALQRTGESAKNLARCYAVSDTTIRLVCSRRIWQSV